MKKFFFILAILSILNILILSILPDDTHSRLNLNMLINTATAQSESEYPNGWAGDTYTCGVWDPDDWGYNPGCIVWCVPDGYHCVEQTCIYGPTGC